MRLETSALLVCLFLVLTTGKFFNKVNQADLEIVTGYFLFRERVSRAISGTKSSEYVYSIRRIPTNEL
jgi:hypothetical protein